MIQVVTLARRAVPLLVLTLTAGACDRPDLTEPVAGSGILPVVEAGSDSVGALAAISFASGSFRGGIPFGVFHLPKDQYGNAYNGSLGNIYPKYLIDYLETARRSGTRVMLSLPSSEDNFKNSNGTFSLTKWKKQVDRFRGVDFSSYVADGTIIGHYIVDEPHDPANWAGKTISPATVDEMARYSKQIWPQLPTIVRSWPKYLKGHTFKHLDAAWAQYSARHGPADDFITRNVRDAQASGLALVVGMNQLAGGSSRGIRGYYSGRYSMSARELESYGSALLSSSYPCAFISWKYHSRYMGRSDIKSAMGKLAQKARGRGAKSCRARESAAPEPTPPSDEDDSGEEPGDDESAGNSRNIKLTVTGWAERDHHRLRLTWSGASSRMIDVYRNGSWLKTVENDNRYTNLRYFSGRVTAATYVYKVCEKGTSRCSNSASIRIK